MPSFKISARALAATFILAAAFIYLVKTFREVEVPVRAESDPNGAAVSDAIGSFSVQDSSGATVSLITPGEPSIVMINSTTCGWCKRALADIGEMANGRPVPRLKLLTLEGANFGAPMLAKENIVGATLIGPGGPSDQVLLTFRYPGTPTFVAIDRNGKVARTMPGYPIRDEMKHWLAVMVGDQDVP